MTWLTSTSLLFGLNVNPNLCLFLTVTLIVAAIYKLTYWHRLGIPNDISSLWNRWTKPFHESDTQAYRKYGRIVGGYELFQPVLMCGDAELVKEILVKKFNSFPNHRFFRGINSIGGKSIFVLEHEPWKRVRSICSPTFTTSKLKAMQNQITEAVDTLINNVNDACENGQSIDVKTYLLSFTLDTFSSCAFGVKIDSPRDPNNPLVANSKKLFNTNIRWLSWIAFQCPSLAPIGSLFKLSIFDYSALMYFAQLISSLISKRQELKVNRIDFVSLLQDAEIADEAEQLTKRKLTDEEIVDQALIFLIAGHDTTATTLSMLLYTLTQHPVVQQKLIDELSTISDEDTNDWEIVKSLPYLDAVVSEILRFCPPVPRVERRTTEPCELGGVKLGAGQLITIPVHAMHHDPAYFPDPEQFKPERWLPENRDSINLSAYLPFAYGPRSCIGIRFAYMEIKFCLIKLLRSFRFVQSHQTKDQLDYYRGQLVTTAKEIILKPVKLTNN
uniref:Cytochrome P450 monooxygenase n=1 Tax=Panonychus citri TaxID=50023 RepID=V9MHD8_PANCT|nr:cytochrome P450 monooxygenase [Panonychus citri]